jgi:hypothetical protein
VKYALRGLDHILWPVAMSSASLLNLTDSIGFTTIAGAVHTRRTSRINSSAHRSSKATAHTLIVGVGIAKNDLSAFGVNWLHFVIDEDIYHLKMA